jgi:cell division septum initiation protein DivIVA
MVEWKKVSLRDATLLKIQQLQGNDSIDTFINKAINKFRKENEENKELKLELERLKTQGCGCQQTEMEVSKETSKETSETSMPTKEQWKESIQDDPPYEPIDPLSVDCHYHAYNPKSGQHFCEEKPIDGYACARRFQRYRTMKRTCVPIGRKNHNSNGKMNHREERSENSTESTETPKPMKCLRGILVYPANKYIICEENCKLNHPEKYRACHEAKKEEPQKFGDGYIETECIGNQ